MATCEIPDPETADEDRNVTTATNFLAKLTKKFKVEQTNGESARPSEDLDEIGPPKELYLQRRNRCIVISNKFLNQQGQNKQDQLPGYEIDENNIQETFSSLNFKVNIKKDKTVGQMREIVKSIANSDCSEEDCLVLFILSHGTEERTIIGCNNGEIDIQKHILQKLESLKLPILVFIQACRGRRFPPVVEVADDTHPDGDLYRACSLPVQRKVVNSDMFVFYSTMPGDVSFVEHCNHGSFFVNRLCAVLRQYNRPELERSFHLADVVTKVNDLLSTYIKEKDRREMGQVSQVTSSLTKRIYFQPVGNYDFT